jgi:hypothetical protein
MTLPKEMIERARERLSHQVASCIHHMLADRNKTAADLKSMLAQIGRSDVEFVDHLLSATNSHLIRLNELADIAYVLEYDWEMRLIPNQSSFDPEVAQIKG